MVKPDFSKLTSWVANIKHRVNLKKIRRSSIWLFLFIVIIVLATQLTLAYRPVAGAYVDAVAIALFVGVALINKKARTLAISLAILPVTNLVLLTLPSTSVFAQSVIFYDTLLLLTLIYRFWFSIDQPVKNSSISWKMYLLLVPLMIIIGQVLGLIGYAFLRHHFIYLHQGSLLAVCLAAVVFGFAEEMLFRGLIQGQAMKVMKPTMAAVLSAGLYAVMFIDHATLLPFLFALIAGAVLAAVYYIKQSLILTTTINISMKLVYIGLLAAFVLYK